MKINVLQDRGWLFLKNENRKIIIGLYCLPMVSLEEFIFQSILAQNVILLMVLFIFK